MDGERAHAYGQAMRTLANLRPAELDPAEQAVVREAADALLFCEELETDPAAEQALAAFYDLVLKDERVPPDTAADLTAVVLACGPLAPVAA